MVPALALPTLMKRLLRSRLGLAAVTGLLALLIVAALAWQVRSLKLELRAEIRASEQLRMENLLLSDTKTLLSRHIQEQNARIRALQEDARAAAQRAERAATQAAVNEKEWQRIEQSAPGAKEMNSWLHDTFSSPR